MNSEASTFPNYSVARARALLAPEPALPLSGQRNGKRESNVFILRLLDKGRVGSRLGYFNIELRKTLRCVLGQDTLLS